MSRCFPFPPPGYVRKRKADDTDLLNKEKNKEKKQKKEKKDREKKVGKEKREKERSDEKHKEKKDKKEKHRDKKNKDRDKHKSDLLHSDEKKAVGSGDNHVHKLSESSKEREIVRNAPSAEKRFDGVSGVQNGMPVSKSNPHVFETNKSFKHIPDLGRKTMDERRIPNQLSDKNVGAERKKDGGVVMVATGGGSLQESKDKEKEKLAFDGRLDGRGVTVDARFTGSGLVPKSVGMFQNRVGGIRPVEKKIEQKVDGKEKIRETEGEDRKGDRRKEKDRQKPIIEDKDREKGEIMKATTSQEKHIQMTCMKDGGENMKKSIVKDTNKNISGLQNAGFHNIMKDNSYSAANVNNSRKRKDPGLNGIYDEIVIGPNKLARTVSHLLTENGRSSEPCQNSSAFAPGAQRSPMNIKVEPKLPHVDSMQKPPMRFKVDGKECKMNGTISESCTQSCREKGSKDERKSADAPGVQTFPMNIKVEPKLPHVDSMQKPPMRIKVDGKECKINGTISESCTQSSREKGSKDKRKSADAPAKPPSHPDTKYLREVLSVPKMDEWPDFDEQEWLFDSNSSSSRKSEVKSSWIAETPQPQVWARGEWLEPVDVFVLPYVIPH